MPVADGSPSSKMDSDHSQNSSISTNNSTSSKFSDSSMKTESASSSSLSASSCGGGNETVAGDVGFCSSSKPHRGNDVRSATIHRAKSKSGGELGLGDFRLLKKLGFGDIGSVYMADLRGGGGGGCLFAMKVMDKESLAARKKLGRARTEREILSLLDHPFLPTLYSHFETDKFSCLLMEFCSGGDLHTLRQRQPGKHFSEQAARFYASEVLLALEYLHMMGVVYRDLKPENVLVREDGHIMLSDFDLSLRCCVNPTLVKSNAFRTDASGKISSSSSCIEPACRLPVVCVEPSCLQPSCFTPRLFSGKARTMRSECFSPTQMHSFPELLAEPTTARSMSFVGTHEYLAPEIIKGDGHGSAVDWWTYGVFLYELLYGKTPFKGNGNRATLFNVVGQPLKFPESPSVSSAAKDLIRGLLVKDPQQRLAYKRGATAIKQHPFFENISWALIRSTSPPEIPKPVSLNFVNRKFEAPVHVDDKDATDSDNSTSSYLDFEFF